MEFINIATENIDSELGAIRSELHTFSLNAKPYDSYISKSILEQHMFKTGDDAGACVVCSIVRVLLNNYFVNDDQHAHVGESKKLKPGKKYKVLLKSPCLKGNGGVGEMSQQNADECDERRAMVTEDYNDEWWERVDEVESASGVEVDGKQSKKAKRKKMMKQTCATILKASCLNKIEHNDIFRRDIVNILSFWFGYVGIPQFTSSVRQVVPRGRLGLSTIYEWTLSSQINNSFKVLIIPICVLSESQLLTQQSYGLVFNDKEKTLSAYIHKDFDVTVPDFCIVPSLGWIKDAVLPKLKERAELKSKKHATMSIDNDGVEFH